MSAPAAPPYVLPPLSAHDADLSIGISLSLPLPPSLALLGDKQ